MSAQGIAVQEGPGARLLRGLRTCGNWARSNPVTAIGVAILLLLAIVAILAPVIAPHDPNSFDPNAVDQGPSANHLFGTGTFGEDIFSRVLFGARIDLLIGFGAVAIGLILGSALGASAGYFGDPLDEIVMRIMDMVAAFPTFILAMGVAAAIGPSVQNLVFAIALTNVPIYARLMRARFLVVRESQYAVAAIGVGAPRRRILWWHLLPNTWEPIFVQSTLQFGWAILDAAGLSFIGLGIRLPTPEWGVMVSLGVERIVSGEWWISFFPGMAIAIAVMACNLIGDGLRDLLDPEAALSVADLLEVRGLQTKLAARGSDAAVVEDVSFTLAEGEILGIVGESGSGKTMTALSIMGLLPATLHVTAGDVRLRGRDLRALSPREMNQVRGRQVSMVFQNPRASLNPLLRVRVTLDQVLRAHTRLGSREREEKSIALLGDVGLPNPRGVLDRYPHELSGGMCQRVMIALALSSEPELLIADEPTTALDVTIQLQIIQLLSRLRDERGLAQIVITHNLGVVAELCDRVIVMYAGRVIEVGRVETIFHEPRHPYTRALLASRPRMGGSGGFESIPGQVPDLRDRPPGCPFNPRCRYAQEICLEQMPGLDPVSEDHLAACHFKEELA